MNTYSDTKLARALKRYHELPAAVQRVAALPIDVEIALRLLGCCGRFVCNCEERRSRKIAA